MKKTILFLCGVAISGIAFDGCKKGPDDPTISLHSRKGRLVGAWTLNSGTQTSTSGGTTTTITLTSTSGSEVIGTSSPATFTYSDKLTINKDGSWTEATSIVGTGYSETDNNTGVWNWTGRVGTPKNKEQVAMTTLTKSSVKNPGGSTTETYTGSDAPVTVYEIDELKNKTLRLKWNGTDSGAGSSDSYDMTYTQ